MNNNRVTTSDNVSAALGFVGAVQAANSTLNEIYGREPSPEKRRELGRVHHELGIALKLAGVHANIAQAIATESTQQLQQQLAAKTAECEALTAMLALRDDTSKKSVLTVLLIPLLTTAHPALEQEPKS